MKPKEISWILNKNCWNRLVIRTNGFKSYSLTVMHKPSHDLEEMTVKEMLPAICFTVYSIFRPYLVFFLIHSIFWGKGARECSSKFMLFKWICNFLNQPIESTYIYSHQITVLACSYIVWTVITPAQSIILKVLLSAFFGTR